MNESLTDDILNTFPETGASIRQKFANGKVVSGVIDLLQTIDLKSSLRLATFVFDFLISSVGEDILVYRTPYKANEIWNENLLLFPLSANASTFFMSQFFDRNLTYTEERFHFVTSLYMGTQVMYDSKKRVERIELLKTLVDRVGDYEEDDFRYKTLRRTLSGIREYIQEQNL